MTSTKKILLTLGLYAHLYLRPYDRMQVQQTITLTIACKWRKKESDNIKLQAKDYHSCEMQVMDSFDN